ncbi:MAG: hypothetical protein OXM02_01170 [Bacteroidota bacterium]|nr:hypothetical protein [Bacteroidota bacterium]MDE2833116.1 hypothetical protein [Bacteroidota bacterium]
MNPLDSYIKDRLDELSAKIGALLEADVVSITGPLLSGVDRMLRLAIDRQPQPLLKKVCRFLDTPGGVVSTIERMVSVIRYTGAEMSVIVPDKAMSAGTISALSANRILKDPFSMLGPIDPHFEEYGDLVPALAYLNQFRWLNE